MIFPTGPLRGILCCALLALPLLSAPVPAQAQDQAVDPSTLPPEIQKLLREAENKRRDVMNGRFAPILAEIQQHAGDGRGFFLLAIQQVQFEREKTEAGPQDFSDGKGGKGKAKNKDAEKPDGPQTAFSDWKIKNKDLIDDPRLGPAADILLLYLRGHILHAKGDEKGAVAAFDAVLDAVRAGPPTLVAYPLFKDGLTGTIFFKYFDLEEGYFKEKDGYYGTPANVEKLFTGMVLPWYEDNAPNALAGEWDLAIAAAGQAAQADVKTADNFPLVDNPRLLVLKADSLMKAGRQAEAIEILKGVIQKFPAYPEYKAVVDKLVKAVAGKGDGAK